MQAKYQVIGNDGDTAIDTAPMPRETFPRSLAAPSLLAHIIMLKYGQGMPLDVPLVATRGTPPRSRA